MPKVHASIGLVESQETTQGVWTDVATEVEISGDLILSKQRWTETDNVNSNVKLEHRISFIADQSILEQINNMRYVLLHGVQWSVRTIANHPPRLILTLGGVYNG